MPENTFIQLRISGSAISNVSNVTDGSDKAVGFEGDEAALETYFSLITQTPGFFVRVSGV